MDDNEAFLKPNDIKRNGETANPWDARANTADESCMRQR